MPPERVKRRPSFTPTSSQKKPLANVSPTKSSPSLQATPPPGLHGSPNLGSSSSSSHARQHTLHRTTTTTRPLQLSSSKALPRRHPPEQAHASPPPRVCYRVSSNSLGDSRSKSAIPSQQQDIVPRKGTVSTIVPRLQLAASVPAKRGGSYSSCYLSPVSSPTTPVSSPHRTWGGEPKNASFQYTLGASSARAVSPQDEFDSIRRGRLANEQSLLAELVEERVSAERAAWEAQLREKWDAECSDRAQDALRSREEGETEKAALHAKIERLHGEADRWRELEPRLATLQQAAEARNEAGHTQRPQPEVAALQAALAEARAELSRAREELSASARAKTAGAPDQNEARADDATPRSEPAKLTPEGKGAETREPAGPTQTEADLQTALSRARDDLSAAKEESEARKAECKTSEAALCEARRKLAEELKAAIAAEMKKKAQKEEIERLAAALLEAQSELGGLKEAAAAQKTETKRLQDELDDTRQQVASLKEEQAATSAGAGEDAARLREELDAASEQAKKAEQAHKEETQRLETSRSEVESELNDARHQLTSLKEELQAATSADVGDDAARLREELDAASAQAKKVEEAHKEETQRWERSQSEVQGELEGAKGELKAKTDEASALKTALEEAKDGLKSAQEELRRQAEHARGEVEGLKEEMQATAAAHADEKARLQREGKQRLEEELSDMRHAHRAATNELKAEHAEDAGTLRVRVSWLEKALAAAHSGGESPTRSSPEGSDLEKIKAEAQATARASFEAEKEAWIADMKRSVTEEWDKIEAVVTGKNDRIKALEAELHEYKLPELLRKEQQRKTIDRYIRDNLTGSKQDELNELDAELDNLLDAMPAEEEEEEEDEAVS
ncbi:hypothetical protein DIPPA_14614 [Diplonema papillatum]|nr:hypothetical protein DIPPA_14614 [Diplonema papillatum]